MFQSLTLKKFIDKYAPDSSRTVAAQEIQRRPVWAKSNERSFLNSFASDTVWLSPLIIADVTQCLEHCNNSGFQIDAQWFRELEANGSRFVVLDGQNRICTLTKFLKNELTLTGDFVDLDEETASVENVLYKDLPQRLQDKFFTSSKITIAIVEQATRRELLDCFLNYNDGIPVNDMQRRDASFGAIARWVKDLAANYREQINRFIKAQNIKEAADLEFIASAAMILMRQYRDLTLSGKRSLSTSHDTTPISYNFKKIDKNSMDTWYDVGFDYFDLNDPSSPYIKDELDRVEAILKMMFDVIEKQKMHQTRTGSLATRQVWGILLTCEWMYDNNYTYTSAAEFYEKLYNIDATLIDNGRIKFGHDIKVFTANKDSDPSLEAPKSSQYYEHRAGVHKDPAARANRFNELLPEIMKNLQKLTLRQMTTKLSTAA